MRSLRLFLSLLLLTVVTLAPRRVPAQTPAPDPTTVEGKQAEGKARYQKGAQAYSQGRFKDAIDLFLQADALAPSAPLSFNIARSYEKIGDGAAALQWYRDFRRRAPEHQNADQANEQIAALEAELVKKGVQQLTVLSSPLGATVIIDDQPLGVTPFTGQFAPGKHRVVVSLRGYSDSTHQVELPAEHARDLIVPLLPDARSGTSAGGAGSGDGTQAPLKQGASSKQGSRARFGVLPWLGLGAGAAVLGGALGFELARGSAEEAARQDSTQVGRKAHYDRMESRQSTARVLAVIGGALVLTGGVLLVWDLSSRPVAEKTAMSLRCLTQGCVLNLQGEL